MSSQRRGRGRPPPSPGWRRLPRRAWDRGSVALETALVFPVLFLVVLAGLHLAVLYYASDIALQAAQEGLRVARAEESSAGEGSAAGQSLIDRLNTTQFLTGASMSVSRGAEVTTVTVTGSAPAVLPLLPTSVTQEVTGPTERITAPGGGA